MGPLLPVYTISKVYLLVGDYLLLLREFEPNGIILYSSCHGDVVKGKKVNQSSNTPMEMHGGENLQLLLIHE
jgi:hypothetical protein